MFLSCVVESGLASWGVADIELGSLKVDKTAWLEYLRLKKVATEGRDPKTGACSV